MSAARSCQKCGAEFGDEIWRWYYHQCGDTPTSRTEQVYHFCGKCHTKGEPHVVDLEQAVIDAAVEWNEDVETEMYPPLDKAVRALLKARETK